jgi:hypothetical protein
MVDDRRAYESLTRREEGTAGPLVSVSSREVLY